MFLLLSTLANVCVCLCLCVSVNACVSQWLSMSVSVCVGQYCICQRETVAKALTPEEAKKNLEVLELN